WVLVGSGLTTTVAAADAWSGLVPAPVARPARALAAALGLPLATYTAALLANTAVPVWHEARRILPFLFAAGAATSASAAALLTTPPEAAAPARRLALGGAVAAVAATEVMTRRLGPVGAPYGSGGAGRLKRAALGLTVAGAAVVAGFGARSRPAAIAGGVMLLGGALCERGSTFRAGF